jgi:hypothetical protein
MIFNNFVNDGTPLTASIWNEAWGYAGTAASMYDAVGAQQYAAQIYSAAVWANAKQGLTTTDEVVQFNFTAAPAYPSSERSGSLMNWISVMPTTENFRDGITIQRDGYYIVQADVSLGDSAQRMCSSTNLDGINLVPDRSVNVTVASRIYSVMPNTIKAATANAPQNLQPHVASTQTFLSKFRKGEKIIIQTDVVDGRDDRIVYAALKVFLIKAEKIN